MVAMKAIGITCGIGSMLVGARAAGFKIEGNVEWRRYYHREDSEGRNTFLNNYPGAIFPNNVDEMSMDDIERFMGVELALGHPECGNFSNLRADKTSQITDPSDIPLFVDLVAKFKPRFFVMDDLPKSFIAFPMKEYSDRLPEYDLFPEWISNYHYGNPQKWRKRMFMIGALKEERWAFRAGEKAEGGAKVMDVIGDLCTPDGKFEHSQAPNHREHVTEELCTRAIGLNEPGVTATWGDMRDYFLSEKPGTVMKYYHRETGEVKTRFGLARTYWDGHSHVLTGLNPTIHPLTGLPFSIRERARIQGFPDDFTFYGEVVEDDLRWNHDKNNPIVRQTGKAMPVQFCEYTSKQIAAHLKGEDWEATGERHINENEYVDNAKMEYCESVGYADQDRACGECWLRDKCPIRNRKYGIGQPVAGQNDLFAKNGSHSAVSINESEV